MNVYRKMGRCTPTTTSKLKASLLRNNGRLGKESNSSTDGVDNIKVVGSAAKNGYDDVSLLEGFSNCDSEDVATLISKLISFDTFIGTRCGCCCFQSAYSVGFHHLKRLTATYVALPDGPPQAQPNIALIIYSASECVVI